MNAVLSRVLTRLDENERTRERYHQENREFLTEIRDGMEKRLRAVEKWCWGLAGGISAVGALLTLYVTFHAGH